MEESVSQRWNILVWLMSIEHFFCIASYAFRNSFNLKMAGLCLSMHSKALVSFLHDLKIQKVLCYCVHIHREYSLSEIQLSLFRGINTKQIFKDYEFMLIYLTQI